MLDFSLTATEVALLAQLDAKHVQALLPVLLAHKLDSKSLADFVKLSVVMD